MSWLSDMKAGYRVGAKTTGFISGFFAVFVLLLRALFSFRISTVTAEERELRDTVTLYNRVRSVFDASEYASDEAAGDFIFNIVVDACDRAEIVPSPAFADTLFEVVHDLLIVDGSLFGFPDVDFSEALTLEEGVWLRNYLARKERFLSDHQRLSDIWREKIIRILEGIMGYLPSSAISKIEEENAATGALSTTLIDLCECPAEAIERTLATLFDDDVVSTGLLAPVRDQLEINLGNASGLPSGKGYTAEKPPLLPTDNKNSAPRDLTSIYLGRTPFENLFESKVPFSIPLPVRFEHTHIVGGTGHGKTQLIQLMIYEDLVRASNDGRSIIVMDSQGDLIHTISRLKCFDPAADQSLSDRLIIIDPDDVEYPVCLNMFDFDRQRLEDYRPVDRERILNGTIELYEYFFGALLGAELTQKQGVIFKYLARLMLHIPNATVHTLRELMEDGERFRPYMEELPPSARSFFETQFFDRSFNATKKQIVTRLWGVLSNQTIERMFSHTSNKLDMFDAINSGKIILINTAKELLKQEGASIFGRFFVSLISQATIQRAVLSPHERRPTFVYIDEAHDYFDDNIEHLLHQARKYRVGMVLAHQNLDQLSTGLRASVMASTSIKLAGGVSAKDSKVFAQEMWCGAEFIQSMRKHKTTTDFSCWVKNLTPQAIPVSVPLGMVDNLPVSEGRQYEALISANRARYSMPLSEIVAPHASQSLTMEETRPVHDTATKTKEPTKGPVSLPHSAETTHKQHAESKAIEPTLPGRGGREHKYLQTYLQQISQEFGWLAVIEKPILDGAGRVDVSLTQGKVSIACEISVTSSCDQELSNVEKCLAAGFDHVVLVSPKRRQRDRFRKFIVPHLDEEGADRVSFLLPDEISDYLAAVSESNGLEAETVRGYQVNVVRQALSEEEAKERRREIGKIIAQSLRRSK